MSAAAALWPAQPTTEPPGWVPALAEYRPCGGGGKGPVEGISAQYLASVGSAGPHAGSGAIAAGPAHKLPLQATAPLAGSAASWSRCMSVVRERADTPS